MSEALLPGTQVQGQIIEEYLRATLDGHLYRVVDLHTGRVASLHEYMPPGVALRDGDQIVPVRGKGQDFRAGMHRFVLRARQLRQLDHPALPALLNLWSSRGTSYALLSPVSGKTLADHVASSGGRLPVAEAWPMLRTCCDVAELLHAQGKIHGAWDLQGIWVQADGSLLLAPPQVDGGSDPASPWVALEQTVLAPGRAQRGPWTDVYGIAALAAFMLTGDTPMAVQRRLLAAMGTTARQVTPSANAESDGRTLIPESVMAAIRVALMANYRERPASIAQFRNMMGLAPPPPLLRDEVSAADRWGPDTVPDLDRMLGNLWLDLEPVKPSKPAPRPQANAPASGASKPLLGGPDARSEDERAVQELLRSLARTAPTFDKTAAGGPPGPAAPARPVQPAAASKPRARPLLEREAREPPPLAAAVVPAAPSILPPDLPVPAQPPVVPSPPASLLPATVPQQQIPERDERARARRRPRHEAITAGVAALAIAGVWFLFDSPERPDWALNADTRERANQAYDRLMREAPPAAAPPTATAVAPAAPPAVQATPAPAPAATVGLAAAVTGGATAMAPAAVAATPATVPPVAALPNGALAEESSDAPDRSATRRTGKRLTRCSQALLVQSLGVGGPTGGVGRACR